MVISSGDWQLESIPSDPPLDEALVTDMVEFIENRERNGASHAQEMVEHLKFNFRGKYREMIEALRRTHFSLERTKILPQDMALYNRQAVRFVLLEKTVYKITKSDEKR